MATLATSKTQEEEYLTMDPMLRKALRKHNGLRQQVDNVLLGEDGDVWEAQLKNFLARRPTWVVPTAQPVATTPKAPVEKFGLLSDLGIITVPADYVPVTEFASISFPNSTRVFKPGEQVWVRAHNQIVSGTTTSEERLTFLASLKSSLVGPQGIELVYGKRSQLPKGYWYTSFDEKERLPLDAERHHRVPGVDRYFAYDFRRYLDRLGHVWYDSHAFLSFCDPALRLLDA